jgi:hypothetical protein
LSPARQIVQSSSAAVDASQQLLAQARTAHMSRLVTALKLVTGTAGYRLH